MFGGGREMFLTKLPELQDSMNVIYGMQSSNMCRKHSAMFISAAINLSEADSAPHVIGYVINCETIF